MTSFNFTRAGKGYLEIKESMESVYGEKVLKKTAMYAIIKKVKNRETTNDQRHLNGKRLSLALILCCRHC
jgi:hypothetical protein